MLLLQCQFLFHNYSKLSGKGSKSIQKYPQILQDCVRLGSKVILQRKVETFLQVLRDPILFYFIWSYLPTAAYTLIFPSMQQLLMTLNDIERDQVIVEWSPLSIFDSNARFTLFIGSENYVDCHIDGNMLIVTRYEHDLVKYTTFSSMASFEHFLHLFFSKTFGKSFC